MTLQAAYEELVSKKSHRLLSQFKYSLQIHPLRSSRLLKEKRIKEFKDNVVKAEKRARRRNHPVTVMFGNYIGDIDPNDKTLDESDIEDRLAIALAPKKRVIIILNLPTYIKKLLVTFFGANAPLQ